MKASIIIRTKNEERWISSCLESVFSQQYDDFEVILVDNKSDDSTVAKALQYPVKLVEIDKFKPGLAINDGIRASSGDVLICLSGHCIPVHNDWLEKLVTPLKDEKVAGVYGRQQPMSFTTDRDKRDLLTTFGLDPKVQRKDTFFHNANSAFRRDVWEKYPFDEETPHIEDRLWAHDVLAAKMEIHYEPEASVFHYHGIHQDDNPRRRRNVVKILESLASYGDAEPQLKQVAHPTAPSPEDLNTVALIPVRGEPTYVNDDIPLLKYTIEHAQKSAFIDDIYVLTDNEATAELAKSLGAKVPFLRPKELSRDFVTIEDVIKFGIEELKHWDVYPDLCVVLEEIYPFRPVTLIDHLITNFLREGADYGMSIKAEARTLWKDAESGFEAMVPPMPRGLKKEDVYVGLFGLGFVTYPSHIYKGLLGMSNTYYHEVNNALAAIEVREGVNDPQLLGLLSNLSCS
jgi:hypothetical protein